MLPDAKVSNGSAWEGFPAQADVAEYNQTAFEGVLLAWEISATANPAGIVNAGAANSSGQSLQGVVQLIDR